MNVQAALKTQYHSALAMLKQTIDQCPDNLWTAGEDAIGFWHVAYHTLFYTHLYLQPDVKSFTPWERHRDKYESLHPSHRMPEISEPYTKTDMLEYWELCDAMVDSAVDALDLDAADCGFPWYNIPKLDHQINNIRHIQHHAALLSGRLRRTAGIDIPWVSRT